MPLAARVELSHRTRLLVCTSISSWPVLTLGLPHRPASTEQGPGRWHQMTRLRLGSLPRRMDASPPRLVNVHQARTHLFQLLQEVEQGHEVVIGRSGVPIARLVAWSPAPVAAPLAMRGRIELAEDFDAPLDELFQGLP